MSGQPLEFLIELPFYINSRTTAWSLNFQLTIASVENMKFAEDRHLLQFQLDGRS